MLKLTIQLPDNKLCSGSEIIPGPDNRQGLLKTILTVIMSEIPACTQAEFAAQHPACFRLKNRSDIGYPFGIRAEIFVVTYKVIVV